MTAAAQPDPRRLYVEVKVGDSIAVGDGVVLTLEHKSGQRARMLVVSDGCARINVIKRQPAVPVA
jgi:hypothetical protein